MFTVIAMLVGLSPEANYYLENRDNPEFWQQGETGRGVVVYEQGVDLASKAKDLENLGAEIIRINPIPGSIVFWTPEKSPDAVKAFIDHLLTLPDVRYAEPDFKSFHVHYTPNDSYWTSQWGLRDINADDAWDISGLGDTTIKIAVVDQGVQYTHPDLNDHYGSVKGYDFVDGDSDPTYGPNESHGTWTSSIAAAETDNGLGVAGVGNSGLYALRALDQNGGYMSDIGDAIYWAANNGADIVSMSIGGSSGASYLQGACQYAWSAGLLLAASSGNESSSSVSYPARYSQVMAVGATTQSHTRAYFSNYGPNLEIMAPGVSIYGCRPGNSYTSADGTSASCPFVSGAAALLKFYDPTLTNQEIRDALDSTALDLGSAGWDQYYGNGLLDLYAAMQYVGITEQEAGVHYPTRVLGLNPSVVSTRANLVLQTGGQRDLTVKLYSSTGSRINTLFSGTLSSGQHTVGLDLSDLAPGSYILVVDDGYEINSVKLLKR